jgi:hypothetical protein
MARQFFIKSRKSFTSAAALNDNQEFNLSAEIGLYSDNMKTMASKFLDLAVTARNCKVEIQQSREEGLKKMQRASDLRIRCESALESGSIDKMVEQRDAILKQMSRDNSK